MEAKKLKFSHLHLFDVIHKCTRVSARQKKILPPLDNQKKMYPLGIFNYLNRVGQQTLVKQNLPAGFILILTLM